MEGINFNQPHCFLFLPSSYITPLVAGLGVPTSEGLSSAGLSSVLLDPQSWGYLLPNKLYFKILAYAT